MSEQTTVKLLVKRRYTSPNLKNRPLTTFHNILVKHWLAMQFRHHSKTGKTNHSKTAVVKQRKLARGADTH